MTVTVGKAANPIAVTASQSWSTTFSTSAQTKAITAATNAQGTVTYTINSQPSGSYFSISGTTVTAKASTPAGSYSVVVRATAAGNSNYNSGYKNITLNVTISKANNPITVTTSQTWSTTFSTSSQSKTISGASNAQGSVTYAVQSQPSGTYFSISGTNLTAKASTPAGTYTVVIRATAAGNSNYNSGSKDITMTVTVSRQSMSVPSCSVSYNGAKQILVAAHTSDSDKFKNSEISGVLVGNYTGTLTPTSNYKWSDGSTSAKTVTCSITGTNRWECYYWSNGTPVSCNGNPKSVPLLNQRWAYYNSSGTRVLSGWIETGDSYLNPDNDSKKHWYYMSDGYAGLGWFQDPDDKCWYYLSTYDDPTGTPNGIVDAAALTNIAMDIDGNGNPYYFNSKGRCYAGNGCSSTCNY